MLLLLLFPMVFPPAPGAQAGEIIGGQEAQPHSRPYMAFVRIQREGKGGNMCGGFLIREDVMVTAAHCNCNLGNISVLLGAHNFEIDELGTQKIWVRRRIPHPEFNDETLENDLMLLQNFPKAGNLYLKSHSLWKSTRFQMEFSIRNKSHMGLVNHTVVTHFILLGIPNADGLQTILFIIFLAFYLCTLLGNLTIFSAILADPRLHTPMYFFLCNLSLLDIGISSIIIPKYLTILWGQSRVISLGGCMSQVFFGHFLGSTECLLYTVMAYDRYVAICHPLRYLLIMNRRVCALLAAGTWITSSFHATILTSLTFTLPYCGSNVVDYFFCDIFPVVKLACADTYIIETVTLTDIGLVPMTCFLLILASYIRIIYSVLNMNSAEGWRKAASTCASHLVVVTLFFSPCALIYTQPQRSKVLMTAVQIFGNAVTPMLNPAIYTLRNKEMKAALKKLRGGLMPAH
ncbi:unnamed protein product [Caretta caretta]